LSTDGKPQMNTDLNPDLIRVYLRARVDDEPFFQNNFYSSSLWTAKQIFKPLIDVD